MYATNEMLDTKVPDKLPYETASSPRAMKNPMH